MTISLFQGQDLPCSFATGRSLSGDSLKYNHDTTLAMLRQAAVNYAGCGGQELIA